MFMYLVVVWVFWLKVGLFNNKIFMLCMSMVVMFRCCFCFWLIVNGWWLVKCVRLKWCSRCCVFFLVLVFIFWLNSSLLYIVLVMNWCFGFWKINFICFCSLVFLYDCSGLLYRRIFLFFGFIRWVRMDKSVDFLVLFGLISVVKEFLCKEKLMFLKIVCCFFVNERLLIFSIFFLEGVLFFLVCLVKGFLKSVFFDKVNGILCFFCRLYIFGIVMFICFRVFVLCWNRFFVWLLSVFLFVLFSMIVFLI